MTAGQSQTPAPLHSRKIEWLEEAVPDWDTADQLLEEHESPLNLLSLAPFRENLRRLRSAMNDHVNASRIFYAMKANKARGFARAAIEEGAGLDVASLSELDTALEVGATGENITVTGVVKPQGLIEKAIENSCLLVVDHLEETEQIARTAERLRHPARLALRLAGFPGEGNSTQESRFGLLPSELSKFHELLAGTGRSVVLEGIHFHLRGYSASSRRVALMHAVAQVDAFRAAGHPLSFIDIGGGFPVRYLENAGEWNTYHRLNPFRESSYPYWNDMSIERWLSELFEGEKREADQGRDLGCLCDEQSIAIHCEPGRFLLNRSGATLARIAVVKPATHGRFVVVCDMNGTQIRPTTGDLLVDPVHLSDPGRNSPVHAPHPSGYWLFGRYCSENDRIFRRPIPFGRPPEAGDVLIFPNTAGYHMHFMETEGHGYPLAANRFFPFPRRGNDDPTGSGRGSNPVQKSEQEH